MRKLQRKIWKKTCLRMHTPRKISPSLKCINKKKNFQQAHLPGHLARRGTVVITSDLYQSHTSHSTQGNQTRISAGAQHPQPLSSNAQCRSQDQQTRRVATGSATDIKAQSPSAVATIIGI